MTPIERLTLSNIPLEILEDLYRKWDDILRNGWYYEAWVSCSLCRYCWRVVHNKYSFRANECEVCPLPPTRYCLGYRHPSLLHPSNQTLDEWKDNVAKFLKIIDDEIAARRDDMNGNKRR